MRRCPAHRENYLFWGRDEAVLCGKGGRCRPVGTAGLVEDVAHVRVNGLNADLQRLGDAATWGVFATCGYYSGRAPDSRYGEPIASWQRQRN